MRVCKILRLQKWELCKSLHLSVLLLLLSSVVSATNELLGKQLFMAAKMGDIAIVNQLLETGVSPNNWTDWQAKSPLIAAEERHRTEVVMKLISSNADVNHQDHNGDTALHSAVWRFDTDVTRALIEAGAKPDVINARGFTPLKYASFASNYHAHTVKLFIDAGANPNLQDEFGQTAMHFAVDQNKLDVVQVLLDAGADPYLKTNWSISPIDIAVDENITAIINLFKGSNSSTNSSKPQTSPGFLRLDFAARQLYEASRSGDMTRVDQLLYQGVAPDAYKDWQGSTSLILATARGHEKVVQQLIEAGADVNFKDHHDSTPLHLAVQSHKTNMTQMLLTAGANPNSQDKWGASPLLISMEPGFHSDTALLLLMAQAEPNVQDKIGVTALHVAVDKNMTEIVHELLQAGARPDIKTKWGKTAIDVATEADLNFILSLLEGYTTTTTPSITTPISTTQTLSKTTRTTSRVATTTTTTRPTSTVATTTVISKINGIIPTTSTTKLVNQTIHKTTTKSKNNGTIPPTITELFNQETMHKNMNSITPTSIQPSPTTIASKQSILLNKNITKNTIPLKATSQPETISSTITYKTLGLPTARTVVILTYPTNEQPSPTTIRVKFDDTLSKVKTPTPSASSSSSSNSGGISFLAATLYTLLVIGLLVFIIAAILLYRRRIDNQGPPSIYLDAQRIFREPIIDAFNTNILTQALVPSRTPSMIPEVHPPN